MVTTTNRLTAYVNELISKRSSFGKYHKILEINDGLTNEYVNVVLVGDYVDLYSIKKMEEEVPELHVKSIKLSLKFQNHLVMTVRIVPEPKQKPLLVSEEAYGNIGVNKTLSAEGNTIRDVAMEDAEQ
jgi:hypothetical protein